MVYISSRERESSYGVRFGIKRFEDRVCGEGDGAGGVGRGGSFFGHWIVNDANDHDDCRDGLSSVSLASVSVCASKVFFF